MRLYLEKRDHIQAFSRFPVLAIALLFAIFMSFLVLWSVGVNPFEAYLIVGEEIFLTDYGWQDLLVKITPLLLTGAAVALAAQMKLWNIGAEGQFHMGTFAVTWGALNFGHLNTFSLIPFLLILSIIGGGLWGCIPGVLKSRFGVNEIITSLLLNYVAAAWVDYHLFGDWRDPASNNFPITPGFSESARLPNYFDSDVHAGLFLALFVILVLTFLLKKTRIGMKIQLAGDNLDAARYSGISIGMLTLIIFAVSGAIAGMAGFSEVSGVHYRLQQNISLGYGYTGIIVAWLARNHPLGILLSSFLMAVIFVSAEILQIEYGLPISVVFLYQGIILFTVLGSEIFVEYRLRLQKIV